MLRDGQRIEADLIVGADGTFNCLPLHVVIAKTHIPLEHEGVISTVRRSIQPGVELSFINNVYRASLPREIVESHFMTDPDVAPLVDTFNFWMG